MIRRSPLPSVRLFGCAALFLVLLAGLPGSASAQPFNSFLIFPTAGYVEVPYSPVLNPTGAFTFEAWVRIVNTSCVSFAGTDYHQAWWVGFCDGGFRSYLKGGTALTAGIIPLNEWTHVAVTYDGTTQRHYINGELVGSRALAGPLGTSSAPMRIGSDVSWDHPPVGGYIDDVRIWNVARTQDQIRAGLHGLTAPYPAGLVALYRFDGNYNDSVGGHNGTRTGGAALGFYATGPSCAAAASSTALCLQDRFLITSKFRAGAPGTAEGTAHVVPVSNPGSGLFWFFDSNNWEVMVKALNGCGLNNRYWIFSAATTNVFYRLEVFDYHTGTQKIYFNYPGPPAPAVTDTDALATCP